MQKRINERDAGSELSMTPPEVFLVRSPSPTGRDGYKEEKRSVPATDVHKTPKPPCDTVTDSLRDTQ